MGRNAARQGQVYGRGGRGLGPDQARGAFVRTVRPVAFFVYQRPFFSHTVGAGASTARGGTGAASTAGQAAQVTASGSPARGLDSIGGSAGRMLG